MVYNAILRKAPESIFKIFEQAGNFFSTTIHVLQSAVVKIARNSKVPQNLVLYRGLSMRFPANFYKADQNGCRGYTEWGFMSTTANKEVAIMYSGVREGKSTATVLQIKTSSVNRPACIETFSQYPQEREYLWVPLSYMQPEGAQVLEASVHGVLLTVNVDVSSNGLALTVEDLLEKKKQLHVKGFETLVDELILELREKIADTCEDQKDEAHKVFENIFHGSDVVSANLHLGPNSQQSTRHIDGVADVLSRHKAMSPVNFTNAATFKALNEEMLEVRMFATSKLRLWREGYSTCEFLMRMPLRTCHRLMISKQRRVVDNFPTIEGAVQLCTLKGLVHSTLEELNEIGESRLAQLAAEDASPNALRLLIIAGADVDAADPDGATAIFRAAQYGHTECLTALIAARARVDAINHIGATPLYVATQNGHIECLRLLLDAQAQVNAQVQNGATALHMAATEGKRFCLEALLQARADVNRTDLQLCTPLYLAALNGRETCVKSLLAAGADPSIASDDGSTALDVAREEGYQQCIEALENHLRS